jgi:hypothetical protein
VCTFSGYRDFEHSCCERKRDDDVVVTLTRTAALKMVTVGAHREMYKISLAVDADHASIVLRDLLRTSDR